MEAEELKTKDLKPDEYLRLGRFENSPEFHFEEIDVSKIKEGEMVTINAFVKPEERWEGIIGLPDED